MEESAEKEMYPDDRFVQFTVTLSKLNKIVQRLKTTGMQKYHMKAVHTLCLYELFRNPEGVSFQTLSQTCDLDAALISRVLQQLILSGCVVKQERNGKYNALYTLTPEGKKTAAGVTDMVHAVQSFADQDISAEDLDTFYRVLFGLEKNMKKISEKPEDFLFPKGPEKSAGQAVE